MFSRIRAHFAHNNFFFYRNYNAIVVTLQKRKCNFTQPQKNWGYCLWNSMCHRFVLAHFTLIVDRCIKDQYDEIEHASLLWTLIFDFAQRNLSLSNCFGYLHFASNFSLWRLNRSPLSNHITPVNWLLLPNINRYSVKWRQIKSKL